MTALELIDLLTEEVKTNGNFQVYRSLNEGGHHVKISWAEVEEPRDEFDVDEDGEDMPEKFFTLY